MALTVDGVHRFGSAVVQLPSFTIFLIYVAMVINAGIWQKLTKPLSLRPILILYNLLCSMLSFYTMFGFARGLWQCEDIFQKEADDLLEPYFFMYWLTKNVELFDTVFMVLRHRSRQISFLHVYHHATMLLLSDYAYHMSPWPAIAIFLAINSLVHILLYAYYFLTALKPSNTPWWKQRLTEFQILQFFVDFIFAGVGYLYHGFCIYGLLYGILMTTLFSNFYYHAYLKRSKLKAL